MTPEQEISSLKKRIDFLEEQNKVLNTSLKDSFLVEKNLVIARQKLDVQASRNESIYQFMMQANSYKEPKKVVSRFLNLFQSHFVCKMSLAFKFDESIRALTPISLQDVDGEELDTTKVSSMETTFSKLKNLDGLHIFQDKNREGFYPELLEYTKNISQEFDIFEGRVADLPLIIYVVNLTQVSETLVFSFLGIETENLSIFDSKILKNEKSFMLMMFKSFSQSYESKVLYGSLLEMTFQLQDKVDKRTIQLGETQINLSQSLKELNKIQMLLTENEKMAALGEMAGGVAHEINNPMAIIDGMAQLLEKITLSSDNLEAKRDQIIDITSKVSAMVKRVSAIIKSLRLFARDGDEDPFNQENIYDVIDESIPIISQKLSKGNVELLYQRSDEVINVPIRRIQISQVILNLLQNSFDEIESHDPAWIKIEVKRDSNYTTILMTDSGLGISETLQDKIFRPFYTTKEVGRGTGLGLSISKGILEQHGGELGINNSSPNTQFFIRLKNTI